MADSSRFDFERVLAHKFPEKIYTYTERDVVIYALGVGACGRNPVDTDELKYAYHESGPQFIQVLPTFASLFSLGYVTDGSGVPGLPYDKRLLLHGQQYIEIYKPLPPKASLQNEVTLAGLHDKGKAAILELETKALLYRLSGDYNPLHSDPKMAQVAGFSRPILHGLCTLGFAVRAIIKCICKGDPHIVKNILGRFLLHVYPGETLITEMWLEGLRVLYQTKVKERNRTVLSGYVDLRGLTSSL
ncbi:enoyl-CoA hydratase 2, peroxisomal [Carica papaya]|uniref:enoyl-CoA hydratase 2, peroxisomal n=1 Tax=Carica papaya TaxID=3649 RepID=UPI000B8CC727|nr:enoyl-CoA hydratase 2, peroxisomal [Carica papaya]